METLTVIVLTKNEGRHITACLQSALGADELLVVDDFSGDDTRAKAEKGGARVLTNKLIDFSRQRNFALSQARGEWVFYLDADERFSAELMGAVRKHMAESPGRAGSVIRKNFAFGRRHRFGPLKPDRVARLFRRASVHWEGEIHERPVFDGEPLALGGSLSHLTYHSWEQYLEKQYRYASAWAQEAAARGKKATPLSACLRGLAGFFKMFILNLGFLGGPSAWALCWFHGAYTLTKYLKLSEAREKQLETKDQAAAE